MAEKTVIATPESPTNTCTGSFPEGMKSVEANTGNAGTNEMPTDYGKAK